MVLVDLDRHGLAGHLRFAAQGCTLAGYTVCLVSYQLFDRQMEQQIMARASTPTLLSLDRWARLLHVNPVHFGGWSGQFDLACQRRLSRHLAAALMAN